MRGALALIACLALPACGLRLIGPTSPAMGEGSPLARATNGASATFTMTTCAPTAERARLVEETLIQLNQQGVLAVADGPQTQVRVSLNLCGTGGLASAPAAPARAPR